MTLCLLYCYCFTDMEDSATLGSDMSAISGLRGGSPFTELPFLTVSYDCMHMIRSTLPLL